MASKWHSDIQWQTDSNYILRCTDESFGPSKSSGKPMITLNFEVVSPETMNVAGDDYTIAGQKVSPMYFVTKSIGEDGTEDLQKSAECQKRIVKLFEQFELDATSINMDNPTLGFKGKTIYALVRNKSNEKRKSPTKEQLAKGQKQGDVMVNPKTNKPLTSNYPEIGEIFGLAPVEGAAKAF